MKKVLSILVLALVAVQFAFAGDVITQDTKQLPLTARNFINQYFSKPHISHIKIESEILQTKKYEVLLTDRTEIDFDKKGNWLEVDCKKSAVPEALIPVPVKEYVKANFPREIITKIERGRTGVEIELVLVQPEAVLPGSERQVLDSALPVQCSYKLRLPEVDGHIVYKSFPYKYFLQFLID